MKRKVPHLSLHLSLIFYMICFSSLHIVLYFTRSLFLSLLPHSLSRRIAPVSRLPARQRGPGGSNQLNYWEHKNAAANGSWINTLAKLLPRLPLLPQGIKLEILRLRMQRLEATAEAFVWEGGWATAMMTHRIPESCDEVRVEADQWERLLHFDLILL